MEESPEGRKPDFGWGLYWAAIGAMGGLVTSDGSSVATRVMSRWAPLSVATMLTGGLLYAGYNKYNVRRPKRAKWTRGNPYPLLAPYGEDHTDVYFGRDREVDGLVDRVRQAKLVNRRFVPVIGPSGCGKSSLLMAGLLPRLKELRGWTRITIGPSLRLTRATDPFVELAAALDGTLPRVETNELAASLKEEARAAVEASNGDGALPKPEELDRRLRQSGRRRRRIVVLIDQLEELGSAGDSAVRDSFVALLHAAISANPRLVVVAAVRSESLGRFRRGPGSDLFKDGAYSLNEMTWDQLEEVIRGPQRQTKTTIDDSLITRMVEDARRTSDPLSVLSCVLHELYAEYAADKEITASEYEEARGNHSAVAKRADHALDQVVQSMPDHEAVAQRLVLDTWLNFVNVAGPDRTGRRVRYADLDPRQQRVVDTFVESSQFLSLSEDGDDLVVDVRHEAILRTWPKLVAYIDENEGALTERTLLEPLARRWHDSGRQDSDLIKPEWARRAAKHELLRSGRVGEFLKASSDTDDTDAIANNAAREALDVVERDPEQAIRIAQAAAGLKPTTAARFALYRTLASGLRVVLRDQGAMPTSVAWSPDGRLAWGFDDGRVGVRTADGQVQLLKGHDGPVRCVAWSADRRLASGSDDRTVRIWDADGLWSDELTEHEGSVLAVAWAPDGRLASGSEDNNVRIWTPERQLQFVLSEHEGAVRSVAWSHDGSRLASGSDDKSVRVWTHDKQVSTLKGKQGGPVRCVAWSRGGFLASGSDDKKVRVVTDKDKVYLLNGHGGPVLSLAFSADGRLVSGCADKTVRVWGAQKQVLHRLDGHGGPVVSVAWSLEGNVATASFDTVQVFSTNKQLLQTLTNHEGPVVSVAWSPDGRLASGSVDKSVRIWEADGQLRKVHPFKKARVVPPLAWSSDGRLAFGAGHTDPRMRFLARDGSEAEVTPNAGNAVVSVAWWQPADRSVTEALASRIAIGSNNGLVRVCDANGRKLRDLGTHSKTVVRSVAWSPEGRLAAGSDDTAVRIWNLDWQERILTDHEGPVRSVAWSLNGWLASASDDRTVRIWSPDGELLHTLVGHDGPVRSVAWSHEGWLASSSDDNTVRIWTADGDLIHELSGHQAPVTSVAWSPDGRLASGSDDRTVTVWPRPAPIKELQDLAERAQGLRELTKERLRDLLLPEVRGGS